MVQSQHLIPVFVIAGFLGAGKTTLINSILRNSTEPLAVVVNDFGSINIDATLITSQTDDVLELSNGCICCSVGESLADVLFSILDRPIRPSSILIEASGVADPAKISAFTHLDGLRNGGTVVLVDAVNSLATATDPRVEKTFYRQLHGGDLLAMTKLDLASPQQLDAVNSFLKSECPHIPTIHSTPAVLANILILGKSSTPNLEIDHGFKSSVIKKTIFDNTADLERELMAWKDRTLRAKGIVEVANGERVVVHQVGQHLTITPTDHEVTGIVVIYTD